MKLGFLMPNFGKVSNAFNVTYNSLVNDSGKNVGNWVFWNGASLLFDDVSICLIPLNPNGINADEYINKVDVLVIPAANWIQGRPNFSWLAQFIEDLDKPCIMLGLGAQSNQVTALPELSDEKGVLRMLRAVSKRTPWIGVRGEYTLKVCLHHGIENVKVMGCPSIFTNNDHHLGASIEKNWNNSPYNRIAIHSAATHPFLKNMERCFFDHVAQNLGSSYIVQGPQFWPLIFQDHWTDRNREAIEKMVETLDDNMALKDFAFYFRKHAYIPYSVNAWINYLQYHSHSLGSRIHGSILSLSARLPTVCLTIDTRTKELCDTLNIPNVPYYELDLNEPLTQVFEAVRINGADFDDNRRSLLMLYENLLSEFDLEISRYTKDVFANC